MLVREKRAVETVERAFAAFIATVYGESWKPEDTQDYEKRLLNLAVAINDCI